MEPLLAFASVFDDPSEGTFGVSFGTTLKSMALTLNKPLEPSMLEPESIHRLRKEQDTARDLYNSGALSEALWQEVRPRGSDEQLMAGELVE
jgi:hypothetical protein